MSFETLVDPLIGREGGYSNHPADRGGPTRWGVTEAVARKYGYFGDMRELPRQTAVDIYRCRYWIEPNLDHVAEHSEAVAEELLDTGVNMGPAVAGMFLQRALNALNRQAKDYPDVKADGEIGPVTLNALRAFLALRGREGEAVLLKALNCLQGARYIEIAEGRPQNEAFVFGWLRTRVA